MKAEIRNSTATQNKQEKKIAEKLASLKGEQVKEGNSKVESIYPEIQQEKFEDVEIESKVEKKIKALTEKLNSDLPEKRKLKLLKDFQFYKKEIQKKKSQKKKKKFNNLFKNF